MIAQIAIMVFGSAAIWLVGRKEEWKKWGYILGILGQPFWIYTSYMNEQWGILLMTLFYTYSWSMGIYNYWIKNKDNFYCHREYLDKTHKCTTVLRCDEQCRYCK